MDHLFTLEQQYIETLTQEYIENHIRLQERDNLIAENNIEKRDIKGYHGREILELLQNADDAYQKSIDLGIKPECDLVVNIEYVHNVLTIANTGTFFDRDGIKAVVQGNNSPKTGKYIGNKGTGFRSVLNWATKVRIFSGKFAIEFSKQFASKQLEKIKDDPQIAKQLRKNPSLYIPMLAVPSNINHTRPKNKTTIEIEINQENQNDDFSVEKQLSGIDLRILLFLPNVCKIIIKTDKGIMVYERQKEVGKQTKVYLKKIVNGIITEEESFSLYEKSIPHAIKEDDVFKDILLSIAVPDQTLLGSNHIYSYFPLLETDSPFNCVLHATYILGDHRNNISPCDANKRIIKEQLSFLIDVAEKYVKAGNCSDAYRILVPTNYSYECDWHFHSSFSKFNLEGYYIELLNNSCLFKTVNNKLVSLSESPMLIEGKFPKFFTGAPFKTLLKFSGDENQERLINLITRVTGAVLQYEENKLCNCVNQLSCKWSVSQQIEAFIWWNSRYKKSLPHLIQTQKGKWLNLHDECYFLEGDFDSIDLPNWVKVQAIRDEYQNSLLSRSKKDDKIKELSRELENGRKKSIARIISQNEIFPLVKFKYRDRSNIIPAINSSVNTYRKSIQFVKWLWTYSRLSGNEKLATDYSKINMKFPSRDGTIVDSKFLFLGKEYGNTISELIFGDNFFAIPSSSTFGININDLQDFISFLKQFGVKEYPEIKLKDISNISPRFDKLMKDRIKESGGIQGSSSYVSNCKYTIPYIENIDVLLNKLSTENIVEWLLNDVDLETLLNNQFYSSQAFVLYKGNSQVVLRTYYGKIPNYILFLFNEIPWVQINDKRYAPNQLLKGYNLKNNKKFEQFLPVYTDQHIEGIARKLNLKFNDITSVFDKFAFAEKVTDLSSEAFYGLMLNLQESTNIQDLELSRIIYRLVEQPGFERQFEQSTNKSKFFDKGKLLVKYKGKFQYFLAKDSYLPSTRIINKNNFPIVEKGQRTGNVIFVKLFGCREYEAEPTVVKGSERVSLCNGQFQKYFQEFQKYARAYGDRNENIEKINDRLKIILVDSIDILENGSRITIQDDYSTIKQSASNWFVVCHNNYDITMLSVEIENIYSNIANTAGFDAGKVGELFRAESKELREFLIRKEFGSLEVIADEQYRNSIKRNFVETLKHFDQNFDVETSNIDFTDFQSRANCPKIIKLFTGLKIDIEDFEKAGFVYPLSLCDYFSSELESFIRREIRQFTDAQYHKALGDSRLQSSFISTIDSFKCYPQNAKIINSVSYNFESSLVKKYGEWRGRAYEISAEKAYETNYNQMNPENLFPEEIANDLNAQMMIYFAREEEFGQWLQRTQNLLNDSGALVSSDKYANIRAAVPSELTDIPYSSNKNYNDTDTVKETVTHRYAFSRQREQKSNESLKEKGNIGELLIYNALCNKYGKNNVYPHSEAFVELGLLKPGQAESGDYDISYIDSSGNHVYVEVKAGSRNEFYMTPQELKFAQEHMESYLVYFVYDSGKYIVLPKKFWKDSRYHRKDIVEKILIDF